MKIEEFKMQRMQSTWEFHVDYNLSESGVYPMTFEELVPAEQFEDIRKTPLGYLQTNPLPEGCTEGFVLTVTPSAEQIDRDLPLGRWPR